MTAGRDFIGAYRLIRLVRSGQTCQVWDAVHQMDNRRVAIKVLQQEYRTDREQIAFLKHEHEVGKGLQHASVIEIYEFGVSSGIPHLVMELFASKNLKQFMREESEKLSYLAQEVIRRAAEGLAYLHEQGWIHCDIKPDNFLVSDEGEVKLIDFALARKERRGLAKLFGRPSKLQGTRSYMAPEQIRMETMDKRADVYSFGCMVYELLAGKLPYAASSPDELLSKHLRAAVPSVASSNSNVTPDMAALISAMMAKDRNERPSSMNEFLGAFQRLRVFRVRPRAPGEDESAPESSE